MTELRVVVWFCLHQLLLLTTWLIAVGCEKKPTEVTLTTKITLTSRSQVSSSSANTIAPQAMMKCINERYVPRVVTWNKAMADVLPSVKTVGIWWSNKTASIPMTIVTQLSYDRIDQLKAQCDTWGGPISAVVYLGLLQPAALRLEAGPISQLTRAILNISQFFDGVEATGKCQLDIMLVYELYQEERAMMLYPVNLLRNLARLQARTPLIAMMDVDMLISTNLVEELRSPEKAAQYLAQCKNKVVFVLPAFETYGVEIEEASTLADTIATGSKQFLLESLDMGIAGSFDSKRFLLGHAATNFTHWKTATKSYEVAYSYRYEPWVICDRMDVPWHDVRFRGYGQNKIVHVASMNASGYKFVVHSQSFIVHRAHQHTAARRELVKDMGLNSQKKLYNFRASVYGHSALLWEDARKRMSNRTYVATLEYALHNCLHKLSWWRRDK